MAAITEVFVADGAADEQMAGQMLRPTLSDDDDANHRRWIQPLPNLKLVVMDRAHASRRILQRTWDKDDYLNKLLKALIWDKQSLVRVLQHSDVAKELFHDLQLEEGEDEDGRLRRPIGDMGFAKQRFDSCAKPLARLIDHFDAATAAAAELVRRRRSEDPMAKGATRALEVLDDEAVLQLGMLADCAEVTLDLTRFMDTESYDKAGLPAKLRNYCQECDFLFIKGGCFTWSGRTRQVVQLLSRRRLLFPRPQAPRTIGSETNPLPAEVRQRCLARMVNWWRLAQEVLEADFPQHDLLHSFAVFDLGSGGPSGARTLAQEDVAALERWADRLKLDAGAVKQEFQLLRGLAIAYCKKCQNSLEAWQLAVAESQANPRRRASCLAANLAPVCSIHRVNKWGGAGLQQIQTGAWGPSRLWTAGRRAHRCACIDAAKSLHRCGPG
jgi:hypothetical protein